MAGPARVLGSPWTGGRNLEALGSTSPSPSTCRLSGPCVHPLDPTLPLGLVPVPHSTTQGLQPGRWAQGQAVQSEGLLNLKVQVLGLEDRSGPQGGWEVGAHGGGEVTSLLKGWKTRPNHPIQTESTHVTLVGWRSGQRCDLGGTSWPSPACHSCHMSPCCAY